MAQGKGFSLQLQSKGEAEEFCKYGSLEAFRRGAEGRGQVPARREACHRAEEHSRCQGAR